MESVQVPSVIKLVSVRPGPGPGPVPGGSSVIPSSVFLELPLYSGHFQQNAPLTF